MPSRKEKKEQRPGPPGTASRNDAKRASSSNEAGFLRSLRQILNNVLPGGSRPTPEPPEPSQSGSDELLHQLESEIGYRFGDLRLLRRAMTHRSFANEQAPPRPLHNEALEFLGDAILEFLISTWLLELHPTLSEGHLSKMRAYAVSAINLQKNAAQLDLGSYLLLNKGEEKTGGRHKSALQVDAYEALIAAIYLDGGIVAASNFVRKEFSRTLTEIDPLDLTRMDYKTALQEQLQSRGHPPPRYEVLERQGPEHRRVFQVALSVGGVRFATGEGTTIKAAHQEAARHAIDLKDSWEKILRG
ncbi:MAG: ribonuclease III [Acidobacteria bacterium]|nr:ribonuclease III [Acidobacteriota bacterium]